MGGTQAESLRQTEQVRLVEGERRVLYGPTQQRWEGLRLKALDRAIRLNRVRGGGGGLQIGLLNNMRGTQAESF